jgi:hypothetical protein
MVQDVSACCGSLSYITLDKDKRFNSKMKVDLGDKAAMAEKSMLAVVIYSTKKVTLVLVS